MVFIDGQPRMLALYSLLGGPPREHWLTGWQPAAERFIAQPMDAYLFELPAFRPPPMAGEPRPNNFWQGETISSQPAYQTPEAIDQQARFILERQPEAMLIVRLAPRQPESWAALHPDDLVVTEPMLAGETSTRRFASLASERFAAAQAAYCAAVIRYVESRPWADRVIGYANYHLAEGTHLPMIEAWLFDHSPVMQARWRQFLQEKYGTVDALRAAHGDETLSFATAPLPRDALLGPVREAAASLYWQAGPQNAPLRDYLLLTRDLYHRQLRLIARASREAAGPGKLLLHDTLKIPMQGWYNAGFFSPQQSWLPYFAENLAGSGNMDAVALLDEAGIDGFVTPYDYAVRGAGGVFLPEGIADTAVLRGKLFITEQDLRTFAERSENFDSLYARHFGITRNPQEFEAVTWRDLATALTGGYQNYYCDHNDDYFADPAMHAVIRRQNQVLRASVDWPHATVPGIAVILDDRAVLATNGSGHVLHEAALWEFRTGVSRSGVPFRIYQVEDLALENFPEHRVFYFPNLYEATERQKALIARRVLRDGNVVVWGPGSGIRQDAAIGPGSAQALTGFDFFFEAVNYPRRVQITDFDHPITRGLASDLVFGSSVAYGPMLYPISGHRLGLAYSRRGGDHSGLAVATFGRGALSEAADGSLGAGDYAAVFTTAAPLPADLWRGIARYAGAHVYTEENDVLLASEGLVALHTLKSGPRTLRLPGPHRVTDLITGERLAEATDALSLDLQAPATVFFRLERAQAERLDRVE